MKNLKFLTISVFLFLSTTGHTQEIGIKNLVFEGAGIRGIAYAGVIQSLEQQGITKDIEKVGGTSAGALIALLIALEYNADDLTNIVSNTKFQKFNDGKLIFIGGFSRTIKRYGWYRGQKITRWIGQLIEEKTGDSEITFEEFSRKGFKDLYFTATCLNRQKLIVLSKKTYPNMKVKDAIRISMSIPFYYQAVFVDSIGNTYSKPSKHENLDIMIDGGIIGNFPIQIFDSVLVDSLNQSYRVPNYETLGIRVDSDLQIKEDSISNNLAMFPIKNFRDYVTAFYVMAVENLNRQRLTEDDWNRTISVSSVGIGPKVKRLSEDQKQKLIRSGFDNTTRHLKKT